MGRIFIVSGSLPSWIRDVQLIQCHETTTKSSKNILNKLIEATKYREIGNVAIRWDDDCYLLKPLHVKDIKCWYEGTLEDAIQKHHGRYRQIIINTAMMITEKALFYDIHAPHYFNSYIRIIRQHWETKDRLVKSMYLKDSGNKEPMMDCKIHIPQPKEKILEKIAGRMFFSNDNVDDTLIDILNDLYPEKSKWET